MRQEIELKIHEEETKHLRDIQLEPTALRDKQVEDVISIKSYHSSEEINKPKPEEGARVDINLQDQSKLYGSKPADQKLKQSQRDDSPKAAKKFEIEESRRPRNQSVNRSEAQIPASRVDFWNNYEKTLAKGKTTDELIGEPIQEEAKREEESPAKLSAEQALRSRSTSPKITSFEDLHVDARGANDSKENPGQVEDEQEEPGATSSAQKSEANNDEDDEMIVISQHDEDSDSELPLFQQKKYLAKQKDMLLEQANESRARPQEEVKPAPRESRKPLKQEQRSSKNTNESRERNVRKVFEKTKSEDKVLPKEKAQKLGLINSKNPNADFNNPNNPNYKGRLANKIIDNYLPKSKAKPTREEQLVIDDYERRDHEHERDVGRKKYADPYPYYNEEQDDEQKKDYPYPEDPYYKRYRRSEYYEDDRYRPYAEERERYSRFGQPPIADFYSASRGGVPIRGRGRARGRGGAPAHLFEEDFAPGYYGDRRGFAPKYFGQEEQYYYEEPLKYDKKRADWQREDSRDFQRKEAPFADKYREEAKADEFSQSSRQVQESLKPKLKTKAPYPEAPPSFRGRGERGSLRGARGAPFAGREAPYGFGRGRGGYALTQEAFQFKVKEKDSKEVAQSRHEVRSISQVGSNSESKEERDRLAEQAPMMKYVQKRRVEGHDPQSRFNVRGLDHHTAEKNRGQDYDDSRQSSEE